jgi:hypothetical protein
MTTSVIQIFLISTLLILTALFFLRRHISWIRYSAACKKWPHVTGRITEAPRASDADVRPLRTGLGGHIPEIRYSYSVDGRDYEGANVSFDVEIRSNPTLLRRIAEHYEVGEEVAVYYDPKRPGVSVLRR